MGSVFAPFLKMGVTYACFHCVGSIPVLSDCSSVTENQLRNDTVQFSDAPKVQENEPTCKTRTCKKRKIKVSS